MFDDDPYSPDYGNAFPETQPAGRAQMIAPPAPYWSPSDDLRYHKVAQGLDQVQGDLDAGLLHADYGQKVLSDLHQKRTELENRRQQAAAVQRQQAMEQETQQVLQSTARDRAITQLNTTKDAEGFVDRTTAYASEDGRSAHFFQPEPGKWAQMNFEPPPELAPDKLPSDTENYSGARSGVLSTGELLALAGVGATPETPPQTKVEPKPDGTHVMTIDNGRYREVATYGPDGNRIKLERGTVTGGVQEVNPDGSPMGGQGGEANARDWKAAAAIAEMLVPQITPRGTAGQQANQVAGRNHDVAAQTRLIMQGGFRADNLKSIAEEHRRLEEGRKNLKQTPAAPKMSQQDHHKRVDAIASQLAKRPGYDNKSFTEIRKEATDIVDQEHEDFHKKQTDAAAEAARPENPAANIPPGYASPVAPAVPPLGPAARNRMASDFLGNVAKASESPHLAPAEKAQVKEFAGAMRKMLDAHGGDPDALPPDQKAIYDKYRAAIDKLVPKLPASGGIVGQNMF